MREIFGVPEIIEETRQVALQRTRPGQKPGINWVLSVLICFLLVFTGEFVGCIPAVAYLVIKIISNGGTFALNAFLSDDAFMLISLYFLVLTTVLVCLYVKLLEKRRVRTLGFVKKRAVIHYLLGLLVGFAMFSGAVLICSLTGAVKLNLNSSVNYLLIAVYTGGWIIQGMEEEVVCRGFLLTSLSRRYSVVVGVIVNSVAFAAMHLLNPGIGILPFINLTMFGIFASLLFVKTGNIWFCSAIHSIWNCVQGNFYGISVSGNMPMPSIFATTFTSGKELFNGGAFGLEGGLGVTAVLVLGCVILFFVPGNKKIPSGQAVSAAS